MKIRVILPSGDGNSLTLRLPSPTKLRLEKESIAVKDLIDVAVVQESNTASLVFNSNTHLYEIKPIAIDDGEF